MPPYDLCDADGPLPDGNDNFQIDNCPTVYDVFRYVPSKSFCKAEYRTINKLKEIYMIYIYGS